MTTRWHHSMLMMSLAAAATQLHAQVAVAREPQTVLFVCEHGTVKSLLAKVLFEEYAAEAGLRMQAVSRGTRADSTVPPWMQQGLAADHFALGNWRPQTLRQDDLAKAAYVVSFDVPSSSTAATHAPRVQWDSLPSVSKDYSKGRDAIRARVHQLVDSLKRAQPPGHPDAGDAGTRDLPEPTTLADRSRRNDRCAARHAGRCMDVRPSHRQTDLATS
jgi:arsenate reductase